MFKKILIILAGIAIGIAVYAAFTNDIDSVKTTTIGVVDALKTQLGSVVD